MKVILGFSTCLAAHLAICLQRAVKTVDSIDLRCVWEVGRNKEGVEPRYLTGGFGL